MSNRTHERPTSWRLPLAAFGATFVTAVAGVVVSLLGGWS